MASEIDPNYRSRPVPDDRPVEAIIAHHTAKRALVVGPLVVVLFWILRGPEGAIAAAIGVVVVTLNFELGGRLLSRAAAHSVDMYHAAALFGFLLRLGLITASMLLVAWLFDVDRVAFGIAAVGTYVLLLVLETRAVLNGSRRELDWTR